MRQQPEDAQHAELNAHTQLLQARGSRWNVIHRPPRHTWEPRLPHDGMVTQRHCSEADAGHGSSFSPVPRWPAWQSAQLEQLSPAPHVPSPQQVASHALQLLHDPHRHEVASHGRVRVCIPPQELEHDRVSTSVSPGAQAAAVSHPPDDSHPPHVQSSAHVRRRSRVPSPQAPQVSVLCSVVPGVHAPGQGPGPVSPPGGGSSVDGLSPTEASPATSLGSSAAGLASGAWT
jgi:hypothetical protein